MTRLTKRIGFVGLGVMGRPMAANLVRAGYAVRCHSRSAATTRAVEALGGEPVDRVADAAAGADVLITMVPDAPDVAEVALGTAGTDGADGSAGADGEQGALAHLPEGALYIDMSTIRAETARAVHRAAAARGVDALDAPVSGGEQAAVDGTLAVMAGGTAAAFERARPVLEAMATTVAHVGPAGSGQLVKAANQLIVGGTIQLVAEAIVLLEATGIDRAAALDVVAGGLAGSAVLDRKRNAMLAGDFTPGFRVDLHAKDLGIVRAAATEAGLALPVTALVTELMAALRARGHGGEDHTALLRLARELNGRADT